MPGISPRVVAGSLRSDGPPLAPARRNTRKVILPFDPTQLLLFPNVYNQGTRLLGQIVSGSADWEYGEHPVTGEPVEFALINAQRVGRIDVGDGGDDEAGRLIEALGPRALKTLIGISNLLYYKTRGQPTRTPAVLTAREIALATHHRPNAHTRAINEATLVRIGQDLEAISHLWIFAADRQWNPKTHSAPSGWISPFLIITGVHLSHAELGGRPIPLEIEAMLGTNWAAAIMDDYNVVQIAPRFMDLNAGREEQVIRLAWYYLTEFRYWMKRGPKRRAPTIEQIDRTARLVLDQSHLRRSLERFERWHQRLVDLEIIGCFENRPHWGGSREAEDGATGWYDSDPATIYRLGTYEVTPPTVIADAYAQASGRRPIDSQRRLASAAASGI